tara:strand:+ start:1580 stop:1819 length:240 start_codon:yes stop_codon:yes gene_type:complete
MGRIALLTDLLERAVEAVVLMESHPRMLAVMEDAVVVGVAQAVSQEPQPAGSEILEKTEDWVDLLFPELALHVAVVVEV